MASEVPLLTDKTYPRAPITLPSVLCVGHILDPSVDQEWTTEPSRDSESQSRQASEPLQALVGRTIVGYSKGLDGQTEKVPA